MLVIIIVVVLTLMCLVLRRWTGLRGIITWAVVHTRGMRALGHTDGYRAGAAPVHLTIIRHKLDLIHAAIAIPRPLGA